MRRTRRGGRAQDVGAAHRVGWAKRHRARHRRGSGLLARGAVRARGDHTPDAARGGRRDAAGGRARPRPRAPGPRGTPGGHHAGPPPGRGETLPRVHARPGRG